MIEESFNGSPRLFFVLATYGTVDYGFAIEQQLEERKSATLIFRPFHAILLLEENAMCSEELIDIDVLQALVKEGKILWRDHALRRLSERRISRADVKAAIGNGEIIEDRPDDYPVPSCLVLGATVNGRYIHVCCGILDDMAVIITAYYPDSRRWESDFRTRKG